MKRTCRMRVNVGVMWVSKRASSGSAVSGGVVEHRDVFIFDKRWPLKKWATTMSTPARYNSKNSNQNLKHPQSGHVIAKYALHHFENSSFHFNNVGEYFLNWTAAHSFSPAMITHVDNRLEEAQLVEDGIESLHSVLIWPDSLYLHNVTERDIPVVTKLVGTQSKKLSAAEAEKLIQKEGEESSIEVKEAKDVMVMVACSNEEFNRSANKLHHLKAISTELMAEQGMSASRTNFFMTADIRGHRNASKVMIFSGGAPHASGVGAAEDCFESLEDAQAGRALSSHLKALK